MDLAQFRAFCAVVDQGSFSAAADSLGLTQPALSMQLSRLEDEAGLALFLKSGRRKVLSREGTVVLERARRVLAEVQSLGEELAQLRGLDAGTLSVAAGDTVLRHLLTERLADFARRWPGVHFHAWNRTSLETVALVTDGRADVGVLTLPVAAGGLEVRPWRTFRWVAAALPSLWGGEAGPVSVADLVQRTLVLLEPGTSLHTLWSRACLERGLSPGRYVETGSTDLQLDWAGRGLGIAVVPDYALGDRSDLATRLVAELGVGTLALVYRPGRLPRAAEAFLSTFPDALGLG